MWPVFVLIYFSRRPGFLSLSLIYQTFTQQLISLLESKRELEESLGVLERKIAELEESYIQEVTCALPMLTLQCHFTFHFGFLDLPIPDTTRECDKGF